MASLEKREGSYRVVFRFAGKKFSSSLRTRNQKVAIASVAARVSGLATTQ